MRMVPQLSDPLAKPVILKPPSRDWRVVLVLWDRMVREDSPVRKETR